MSWLSGRHQAGLPESEPPLCLRRRLGSLRFTVAGRSRSGEGAEEGFRRLGHMFDRPIEGGLIGLRGGIEAADLADELQRRRTDLLIRGRRVEIEEGFDIPAHGVSR